MIDKYLFNAIENLKKEISTMFKNEKTGHDISHLENVLNYALQIQKIEGGDIYVVAISALMHDIHRIMANEINLYVKPIESLPIIEEILIKCDVEKTKINHILEVIKYHDEKVKNDDFDIETKIIQDADILDAIGKRGLERTLQYCKTRNIPICDISEPLDSQNFVPDFHPISTCHYVYRIMIPLVKNLNTKTAKFMVKDELDIMENFIKENQK